MRAAQIQLVSEYPGFHDISEASQRLVSEASSVIPCIRETNLGLWMRLLGYDKSEIFTGSLADLQGYLSDPLEDAYREYHGITATSCRPIEHTHTFDEIALWKRAGAQLEYSLSDQSPLQLLSFLESTSSSFLGRESKCRNSPVYLLHDVHGLYIEYLESKLIPSQISVIEQVLLNHAMPALYRAIVAHVMLIGAHPFEDGNGRVARLTFNAILAQSGLSFSSYIPLREIFGLSTGALSIQTRRALLQNKWDSIVKGFSEAVLVTWRLNQIFAHLSDEDEASLPSQMGFLPHPTPTPELAPMILVDEKSRS
jgi:hypothetical protein